MVSTNLLKGKIVAKGLTQKELAKRIQRSPNTLNMKINNKKPFDLEEVFAVCEALDITDPQEKIDIFLSKTF